MTRAENKRFLRLGFALLNLSAFSFFSLMIGRSYEYLPAGSSWIPVLVTAIGLTGISAFIFLVILGLMPHLFKFDRDNVASDREKKMIESLGFFILED